MWLEGESLEMRSESRSAPWIFGLLETEQAVLSRETITEAADASGLRQSSRVRLKRESAQG